MYEGILIEKGEPIKSGNFAYIVSHEGRMIGHCEFNKELNLYELEKLTRHYADKTLPHI